MHPALRFWEADQPARRRINTTLLLIVLMAIHGSTDSRAQAWPQRARHFFVKLSSGNTSTGRQFDANGRRKSYDTNLVKDAFRDKSYYLYVEYGLSQRLTIIGQMPLKHIRIRSTTGVREASGPGDVEIGARYGLMSPERVGTTGRSLAGIIQLRLPAGYTRNLSPSVGSGQMNILTGLSLGQSLYPFPGYLQGTLAYRVRTTYYGLSNGVSCPRRSVACLPDQKPDFGDEWVVLAEAGFSPHTSILIQAIAHGIWSNENPVDNFDPRNPLPTRQRLLKTGVGVTVLPFAGFGISVLRFATPTGRNTIDSIDWFFGLQISR